MREHLPVQWTSDMSKPGKSNNETAAAAADTPGKTAKSQREPKKKAKHLAKEWGEKIKLTLEAGQKAQKALAEYIIPYFNEVQREIASEIASKDFIWRFRTKGAETRSRAFSTRRWANS
jgi:hypothetical protein